MTGPPTPREPLPPREEALLTLLRPAPLPELIPDFLSALCALVPFDRAALLAGDAEFAGRAWRAQPGAEGRREFHQEPWHGPEAAAVPAATAPIEDPFLRALLNAGGWGTTLAVPLRRSGDGAAMLLLARAPGERFEPQDLEAAEPLWTALAAALRRERARRGVDEASRAQAAELGALFDLVGAAARAHDPDELFGGVAASLQPLVDFDALAVLRERDGRPELTLLLSRALLPDARARIVSHCADAWRGLTGIEAPPAEAVDRTLPGFDPDEPPTGPPAVIEVLPILRRGTPTGLIAIAASRPWPADALSRVLTAAGAQIGLTLDRLLSDAEARADLLRALIDSLPDGVVLTDSEGRVEMRNRASAAHLTSLTGSAAPAALQDLGGLSFPSLAASVREAGHDPVVLEISLMRPRRLLRLSASPLHARRGRPAGLVLVTSDITRERAVQEQMHLTEKLSALGEMISGIAHELNNPLASVIGFSQLLQSAKTRPEVARKLGIILAEAQRCQKIVQNLLSFARSHAPERQPVSLNEVVTSVLALVAYPMRTDGIEVRTELADDLPVLDADFHQLQQVILNLVTNAQHALHERAGDRLVIIRSRREDGCAVVEVVDNGPGIEPEDLGRIFDPFFTTKEVGRGTGLGLSLSSGIVATHGGRIDVRSEPGQGALFSVRLPGPAAQAAAGTAAPAELETDAGPGRAGRILVVEDEPSVARLLEEALEGLGHRVETAPDGRRALERLASGRYDLIITDMKMPRLGGRELYEDVASRRPELASRFVFSTGDLLSEDVRSFLDRAGRPVLSKPFLLADLRRVVRSVLDNG